MTILQLQICFAIVFTLTSVTIYLLIKLNNHQRATNEILRGQNDVLKTMVSALQKPLTVSVNEFTAKKKL